MSQILAPSIKDHLWHRMRRDLAKFIPEVAANRLLMCCACGRFLQQEAFSLEHLIPQQALKADPESVRSNPATPANLRSGNLLLCSEPLRYKGLKVYNNGCNSWKGRFYDKPISEIFSGRTAQAGARVTDTHIISALVLGYLAMVAEFGYSVVLMQTGLLMRQQFFLPRKFHSMLGTRHQILLGGTPPTSADEKVWSKPFSFAFHNGACVVTARNFAIMVPISRDPHAPIARHLKIVPSRFKLRPDFHTVFD